MRFSPSLLLCGQALTLVEASRPAKGHSLFSRANRPTVTETITILETTVSDCPAPKYTAYPDQDLFSLVIPSTRLRTILETPSAVVYNVSNTVRVVTRTITNTATVCWLPPLTSVKPQTSGVLNTELGEEGQPTQARLLTSSIPTLASLPTFTSTDSPASAEATPTAQSPTTLFNKGDRVSTSIGSPVQLPDSTVSVDTGFGTAADEPQSSSTVPNKGDVVSASIGAPVQLPDPTVSVGTGLATATGKTESSSAVFNKGDLISASIGAPFRLPNSTVSSVGTGFATGADEPQSSSTIFNKGESISTSIGAPFQLPNSTVSVGTGFATGTGKSRFQPTGASLSSIPSTITSSDSSTSAISTSSTGLNSTSTSATTTTSLITSSSVLTTSSTAQSLANTTSTQEDWNSADMELAKIFAAPIDIKPLPRQFSSRPDHPVPRTGIQTKGPLQTNKFYSNLFLGNQRDPVFTYPYSISWVDGTGVTGSHGMAVSHVDEKQRVFGPPKFDGSASYFIHPIGIHSMVISARELSQGTKMTLDSMTASSIRAHLSPGDSSAPLISFPLVQGMAYITAEYNGGTPLLQSGIFFRNVTRSTQKPKKDVTKYSFVLEDGTTWRVYGYKTKGDDLDLQVLNNGVATSSKPFYGLLQVAKESTTTNSDEESKLLDQGAGIYPTSMTLDGSVKGAVGSYQFTFDKSGHQDGELLMFALPHHVQSFDKATLGQQAKGVSLMTPTKGSAALVQGTKWNMVEPAMPVKLGFDPFDAQKGSLNRLSDGAKSIIKAAASKEILQDMIAASDLDSMYFSGKALAKYAFMLYVISDMLGETKLAQTGLGQLKTAFARFADNKQKFPLVHETAWGGVVSSGAYRTGQALEDFGNTYYNDHHFHYGYHILAAAVIGHLDKTWVAKNKDYVNMLARDTSNPSSKDTVFPEWRSFDWYHGHSWATGLYASLDGKNQESSSEDMMHAYGLKMWGKVSRNGPLEARANLQLAITARSLQQYYLYETGNTIQPGSFIGNKVAGILFENKVDHTTFFGNQIEFIQGIHMIPILPVTTVARTTKFAKEEWEAYFSNGRLDLIDNGWKSILLGSLATIDPKQAFAVLSGRNFDSKWLDGGVSLTWLLAYSAALGGL